MTRINIGIPVTRLIDQHLIAEYNELPRIPILVKKRFIEKKEVFKIEDIPKTFTLNQGHVKFFYNKGLYLYNRFTDLVREMNRRGFKANVLPADKFSHYLILPNLYNDYEVRKEDLKIINARIDWVIRNRLKVQPRYNREKITISKALHILNGEE